jgi:hypothetical protein
VAVAKPSRRQWSLEQKARILAEASKLTGEQLSTYLEREGVKLADFERWRVALEQDGTQSAATTKLIRRLERELARKEEALAEAAALLVLKKNGGERAPRRGRRHRRAERELILTAITTAQSTGARLARACRVAGISARTIERWRLHPQGDDRRCGPHRRPGNALSTLEEAQILSVLSSPRYGTLSPRQLVPRLADEGRYLASESNLLSPAAPLCAALNAKGPRIQARVCRSQCSRSVSSAERGGTGGLVTSVPLRSCAVLARPSYDAASCRRSSIASGAWKAPDAISARTSSANFS